MNKDPDIQSLSIAVVDDDAASAQLVAKMLRPLSTELRVYKDPEACLRDHAKDPVDLLITDLRMPGMDGLALLKNAKTSNPETEVIIITGYGDKLSAIDALRGGAFDLLEKPLLEEEILASVRRTARFKNLIDERNALATQTSFLAEREASKWGIDALEGRSPAMKRVLDDIRAIQRSPKTSLLIVGESGTGKELVARAVHFGSARSSRAFLALNCAALPSELAESILFGHMKGSFTGAAADARGQFELADGGTLFLDEIGAMPPALQTKLLRVLEDGRVTPVGAQKDRQVDVRVIAATNEDLSEKMRDGGFRVDLYHRLAVYTIALPPLRERKQDIPILAQHFVNLLSGEMGGRPFELAPEVAELLLTHGYPGNIRELRNTIERALIASAGQPLRKKHISFFDASTTLRRKKTGGFGVESLPLDLKKAEEFLIRKALLVADGNVSKAARLLGINRSRMYRKLAALGESAFPVDSGVGEA